MPSVVSLGTAMRLLVLSTLLGMVALVYGGRPPVQSFMLPEFSEAVGHNNTKVYTLKTAQYNYVWSPIPR